MLKSLFSITYNELAECPDLPSELPKTPPQGKRSITFGTRIFLALAYG
jgi:hypothetical protein